jgi:hypothetical protein
LGRINLDRVQRHHHHPRKDQKAIHTGDINIPSPAPFNLNSQKQYLTQRHKGTESQKEFIRRFSQMDADFNSEIQFRFFKKKGI